MELEPLLAILKQAARNNQGDEDINILPESWQPFLTPPGEEGGDARKRCIYLLNTLPLGRGSFGIVFAALMVVGNHNGVNFYAPVAMKMAPVLRDHLNETVNGLAMNELILSGCTPGLARLMDSFCVNGSLEMCRMPPTSWKDLWNAYDLFVYSKCEDIRRHYGHDSVYDVKRDTQTARLSSGCTVGFLLTELSPVNLTTSVETTPTRIPPSISTPIDAKRILQRIYVRCQALAAVHAGNMLHLDVHSDNFIESMPISDRCNGFPTPLNTDESQADRNATYGAYTQTPQIRDDCYGFLMRPLPTACTPAKLANDARDNAVMVDSPSIPLLIDFGAMRNAQITYDKSASQVRTMIKDIYFAKRDDIKADDMPQFGFSHRPMQYDRNPNSPHVLPLMIAVQSPTTNVISRAPEQMNPFVIRRPHPIHSDREEHLGIGIMSELGDVYSLMTVVVAEIIGFDPFSQQLPLCKVPSTFGKSGYDANNAGPYRVGIEVHPTNVKEYQSTVEYKLSSVFGSTLVESKRETGRSSASNYDLRLTSSNQPRKLYDPSGQMSKSHDYYIDDTHVKLASFVDPKTGLHKSNGDAANNSSNTLYGYVEAYIRSNAPKIRNYTRWVGYKDDKFDEVELAWTVRAMVARIEAVGVPGPDECQGTFFYQLFRNLERIYAPNMISDGWLPDVLQRAVTHRLGLDGPEVFDFLWLCRDALSWEPSRRPPAHRILECPIFARIYAPQASINCDPRRFWSAALPTPSFWPQVPVDEMHEGASTNKRPISLQEARSMLGEEIGLIFCKPRTQRSFVYDSMLTSLNMVKYWTFVSTFGRLPGFMTANSRSNYMPLIHPAESQQIAICNLNTGLLDYHTGTVCVNYTEGMIVMVHAEGLLPHFNARENVGFYCNALLGAAKRTGALIPEWILFDEELFKNLDPVMLTERRQKMRTKFFDSGRSIEELLPDSHTFDKTLEYYKQHASKSNTSPPVPTSTPVATITPTPTLAVSNTNIIAPTTPAPEDGEIDDMQLDTQVPNTTTTNSLKRGREEPETFERNVKSRVDSYRPNQPVIRKWNGNNGPPPPRIDRTRFDPAIRGGRGRGRGRGRGYGWRGRGSEPFRHASSGRYHHNSNESMY